MKFLITACFSLLMLVYLLAPLTASSAQLEIFNDVSDSNFSLPDVANKTHSLQDYKGKVVLVNFWASWCPPCIHEMPELTRLKHQIANSAFEVLAINVGEQRYKVRKFTRLINFNLPVLLDTRSETFNHWGVKTLPTSFLVDKQGQVLYRVRGNPGWASEKTMAIINKLLDEKPVAE